MIRKLLGTLLFIALVFVGLRWFGCGADGPAIDATVYREGDKDDVAASEVLAAGEGVGGDKPNIVLILADDLGYGDLRSYAGRAIRTPQLDRLSAEGVQFSEFYSSAPVCSPSRAGLLTGRYPIRTGISYIIFANEISLAQRLNLNLVRFTTRLGMADFHDSFVSGLPRSEITIAEALKVAGYATGMVGKWHLGDFSHDQQYLPTRHGFDFYQGIPHSNDEMPVAYWRNEEELSPNIGLDQEWLTAELTDAAIGFIEQHKQQPFFLYFAHKDVHLPFFPSERFRGKSPAGLYGDAAEELDWSVGRILEALDRNGLRKNTLVIFTSDNGPWYEGSTHGLRGRKGMTFEGGLRVPFIASWPGMLPQGAQIDAPAMNIDVLPTLLRVAGLEPPSDRTLDGRDLWDLLSGRQRRSPHDALFFFHDKTIDGVRSGRWKYFRFANRFYWPIPLDKPNTVPGRRVARYTYTDEKSGRTAHLLPGFPLLYDVALDPGESYNVLDRNPEVAERLHRLIEELERDLLANPRGWK